jgi:hypothetical protein
MSSFRMFLSELCEKFGSKTRRNVEEIRKKE